MKRLFFVTGTDTGVGKTVLTCLLARHWISRGISVAGVKPLCSGGRDDAEAIFSATGETLSIDEINPWHFSAPVSPLIAARKANRKVTLAQVVQHIEQVPKRFSVMLVEGAGGLLSPMGEGFDSRDLIKALRAIPIIVGINRLGIINQIRLVLAALPKKSAGSAQIVLMSFREPDVASRTNVDLLAEFVGRERLHVVPWLGRNPQRNNRRASQALDALTKAFSIKTIS